MTRAQVEARIKAHPVKGTPAQMRAAFDALTAGDGPAGQPFQRGGLTGLRFGRGPDAVWLHGGGYVFGSARSHAACAAFLAQASGHTVWVPEYRLAPEATWPAPLEDARQFIGGFGCALPLIGDSAGGHLALSLARSAPELVSHLVLISPNTDRSGLSSTRQANTPGDLMNADTDDGDLGRMAMPDTDPGSTAASPLRGDLSALPPVWITAATDEVLLDDSLLLVRALGLAGVSVTAEIRAGLFHLWTLWPDHLPEAAQTLSSAARFLAKDSIRI